MNVSLAGTGVAAPTPNISVSPFLDFGETVVGESSAPMEMTIFNTGTAVLNVSNISLPTTMFSLDTSGGSNPCGSTNPTIAISDNCTVEVTFTPDQEATVYATIQIYSDDPDEPIKNFSLAGTSVAVSINNPPSSPNLVYPVNGQQGLPSTVTLEWEPVTAPDGETVSYDVYYCTSADPANNCAPVTVALQQKGSGNSTYLASLGFGGGIVIFGITLAEGIRNRKRVALLIATIALASALVASCGSGNNDNEHTPDDNNKTYTVSGLDSNATYYWTVIAKDGNGGETQSDVWSFKTQ